MATPSPFYMPLRGEPGAPEFDPREPRSLPRYFDDLADLFVRAQICDDAEKKRHALRYVSLRDADCWELLDEFDLGSFDDWQRAILALYPGADDSHRDSRRDLDDLVQRWRAASIKTLGDWAEFSREFFTISRWLMRHKRLSEHEQSKLCSEALTAEVQQQVAFHLEVKYPEAHSEDGYSFAQLDEAVRFVLGHTTTAPSASPTPSQLAVPEHEVSELPLAVFATALERAAERAASAPSPPAATFLVVTKSHSVPSPEPRVAPASTFVQATSIAESEQRHLAALERELAELKAKQARALAQRPPASVTAATTLAYEPPSDYNFGAKLPTPKAKPRVVDTSPIAEKEAQAVDRAPNAMLKTPTVSVPLGDLLDVSPESCAHLKAHTEPPETHPSPLEEPEPESTASRPRTPWTVASTANEPVTTATAVKEARYTFDESQRPSPSPSPLVQRLLASTAPHVIRAHDLSPPECHQLIDAGWLYHFNDCARHSVLISPSAMRFYYSTSPPAPAAPRTSATSATSRVSTFLFDTAPTCENPPATTATASSSLSPTHDIATTTTALRHCDLQHISDTLGEPTPEASDLRTRDRVPDLAPTPELAPEPPEQSRRDICEGKLASRSLGRLPLRRRRERIRAMRKPPWRPRPCDYVRHRAPARMHHRVALRCAPRAARGQALLRLEEDDAPRAALSPQAEPKPCPSRPRAAHLGLNHAVLAPSRTTSAPCHMVTAVSNALAAHNVTPHAHVPRAPP